MRDKIVSFDWVQRLPRLSNIAESELWLYISTLAMITDDYDIIEKIQQNKDS